MIHAGTYREFHFCSAYPVSCCNKNKDTVPCLSGLYFSLPAFNALSAHLHHVFNLVAFTIIWVSSTHPTKIFSTSASAYKSHSI